MSELFTFEGFKKSDLCHHGIIGQKWGVRRYQNPDGSLTQAGKRRYQKGDTVYEKGTKFYRISSNKEDVDTRDYKYVSFLQKDRDYYKGMYSQDILFDPNSMSLDQFKNTSLNKIMKKYKDKGLNIYEITYEAKEDLLSPSKNKRVKAFQELIEKNPNAIDDIRKQLIEDKWYARTEEIKNGIEKVLDKTKYKKYSDIVKDDRAFKLFSAALNDNDEIRKQYFNILKDKGYNIIIDDNDAGELASKPLIVINPAIILQKIKAKELMADDIAEAYNRVADEYNKSTIDEKIEKMEKRNNEWY